LWKEGRRKMDEIMKLGFLEFVWRLDLFGIFDAYFITDLSGNNEEFSPFKHSKSVGGCLNDWTTARSGMNLGIAALRDSRASVLEAYYQFRHSIARLLMKTNTKV
jgi:hypothetical protein